MAQTDAPIIEAYNLLVKHKGSSTTASKESGIPRSTLQDRARSAAEKFGVEYPAAGIRLTPLTGKVNPDALGREQAVAYLKGRVRELEAKVAEAGQEALDTSVVKHAIIGLAQAEPVVPAWLNKAAARPHAGVVPVVFLSDWHWGEVVDPTQINGVNLFNLDVAHQRAELLVQKTKSVLREQIKDAEYPGIIVALGGDMVSGDIHEELSETNDKPMMPIVLDLWGVLIKVISDFADEFGRVFVPAVTGNHGRTSRKPKAKNRVYTNFDWLVYQMLAKHFEGDDRVTFLIPDGPDALFSVYGHRYLLTHGDQFRGGDGMIGALGPITRGNHKKQSRNAAIDQGYDTLMIGHWHQYIPMRHLVVNGSLKGYDEYANANNFGYEPAIQSLWLSHPEMGITMHMPLYLDSDRRKGAGTSWVSWPEA